MINFSLKLAPKQSRILCLLSLLLVGGWSQLVAQRSNSVYIEIGGAAAHYSINYERLIVHNDKFRVYGSVGFSPSLLHIKDLSPRIPILLKLSFPVTMRGPEIEIGGGITPYWWIFNNRDGSYSNKKVDSGIALTGRIGVRHQLGSRTYLGCYYTPFFGESYEGQSITHWGAVTVGVKF